MNNVTDVVHAGMQVMLPFQDIRRLVYQWAKAQGHFIPSTDRVHETHAQNIRVTYWHNGCDTHEVLVGETSTYTKKHPLPTW
jgi:hypothetical protein